MTRCSVDPEKLMAWVDGALEAEEARDVACQVATCPDCQEQVAKLQAETDALRKALGSERAPAGLYARISTRLAMEKRPSRMDLVSQAIRQRASKFALGAAVATSLLIAAFLVDFQISAPKFSLEAVAIETTQDYEKFQASARVLDVASDNPEETFAWLSARLDEPFPAVPSNVLEYQLVGGRLCLLLGQRLGALTYDSAHGEITVYVFFESQNFASDGALTASDTTLRQVQSGDAPNTVGSAVWAQEDLVIAVLSTLSNAEKDRFAKAFRSLLNNRLQEI